MATNSITSSPSLPSLTDIDAQCSIDDEIAKHEAAILALKTQRNMHSSISKLPVELIAKIFMVAKDISEHWQRLYAGIRRTQTGTGWLNVAGVCRRWREIVLDMPKLWSVIDISRTRGIEHAIAMLRRSKDTPLWINCTRGYASSRDEAIAEVVLSQISRIQELYFVSLTPEDLLKFLSLNTSAAPILEVLRINNYSGCGGPLCRQPHLPVMKEILSREMPSLRVLDVTNCYIPSVLPPLPRLTRLKIALSGSCCLMAPSLLLSSLQNLPNLEDLEFLNSIDPESFDDTASTGVELSRLSHLAVSSTLYESAIVFKYIRHPPTTHLKFVCTRPAEGESDFPNILELCSDFGRTETAQQTTKVEITSNGEHNLLTLRTWIDEARPTFAVSYTLHTSSDLVHFLRLCNVLPLSNVHTLLVGGLKQVDKSTWLMFLSWFKQVEQLRASHVNENIIHALLKESSAPPPLPELRWLAFSNCTFNRSARGDEVKLFNALLDCAKERDDYGTPLETLEISECMITGASVEKLYDYIDIVEWDGDDSIPDSEDSWRDSTDNDSEADLLSAHSDNDSSDNSDYN